MKRFLPLLAILSLLGALAIGATTAAAASTSRPSPNFAPVAFGHPTEAEEEAEEDEEIEAEEGEFEFEECESGADEIGFEDEEEAEVEEELDEGCEEAARKKGPAGTPFVTAPVACQVSRAESTITTLPSSDQVRLTVRYRTWAPTPVTVSLKLRDHKGAVGIEHTTKHLGGRGVLHITTTLGSSVMERALDASEFDVALRAPESPGYCADALEQRLLSVKHTSAKTPRVYSD
jgi:hypothetical protein